ncbi:hypothetical protein G5V59_07775 [Nocardioides sp. W3-2-3]|uniref:DUF2231 domain-containing protein n=1 Tax=Nocardioides convexus TaxID=2712224 RepID=UPI00241899F9|nr:DUF2231 domain-containing protein [Nocardioides convexus]NHA00097.1 hypothetical protein [Nocardioides convexus]
MEINGVPLHPLVVHAAVVFTPLAALAALAYAVPSWRDRVRWPLVVLAAISLVSIWVAYLSGEDLRTDRFGSVTGTLAERIEDHEEWAEKPAHRGHRLRGARLRQRLAPHPHRRRPHRAHGTDRAGRAGDARARLQDRRRRRPGDLGAMIG